MFPMKLDDLSHIVIQHFFSFWCWNPVLGYDCSPQAGIGTQAKAQPYHSHHLYVVSHLIVEIQNCLPGMLDLGHYTLYILHTSISVGITVSQTGTASLKSHLKNNQPRPTHFMSSPWLITRERHLEVVAKVIMTSHTGHHDLGVIQPQPNLSSSSKPWQNPFVQQTKFSTHWVLHSDDHPTHILHPTRGHASGSLQEGQVPFLFFWSRKPFTCTHPSKSVSSIIHPASDPLYI